MTGDDFGLSVPVNEAIEKACRNGILTTASLMVGAPAVADALDRARNTPQLNVGLHLVLTTGKATLPPTDIPDLVDTHGMFSSDDVVSGIRMFFLPAVKQQLAAEIRAQFEAFKQTGLTLDHVNAHRHMHLHPTVLDLILDIGRDYGLTAVRLPAEPVLDALVENRQEGLRRRFVSLIYRPLVSRMKKKLQAANIRFNERVFGFYDSGHMNIDRMIRIISHLPDGLSEMYTHPATGPFDNVEAGAKNYEYEAEYKALVHPRIRRAIEKFAIETAGFND